MHELSTYAVEDTAYEREGGIDSVINIKFTDSAASFSNVTSSN
jgi:hypothetical protein